MIFVVDACVACSMGGPEALDPISKNCRHTLMEIFSKYHTIAISDKILEEYKRNGSRFFRDWLISMISKSRFKDVNGCENQELRDRIKQNICIKHKIIEEQQAIIKIVFKDVHLLEAALVTDKFIISNDSRSRNHLVRLMKTDDKLLGLAIIYWVISDEILIEWLKTDASNHNIPKKWSLDPS
ncbi:MAG: hypothetical protein STSR0009_20330 [Methanoregula sp.]